ncbi:MAG: polyprenyl synthetase family protein [Candidatus Syntrophonatronum acetioxidans]|uniref:Polyprenyl synthetase family protein n=1 Tax=Candidatus Syntrophonatronum acetioxidans TaxID=1795816 RepID=A0A424YEV5_9FIRM|nr:MAG: polyprenyl synthetase family protein [Candidatus Syntrophonatronum acetioxidans]
MNRVEEVLKEACQLPELKMVERKLENALYSRSPFIKQLSTRVLKGGKRLRPLLVILSASFYPHSTTSLVETCTAVELIHTASLVHDDILDAGDTRRGIPTINSQWGNSMAVLTGDFLFARAFEILARNRDYQIMELMTSSISLMCEGEVEQARLAWNLRKGEEKYLEQIYKKTAFFISSCCRAGGFLAEMSRGELDALACYGLHLGYAYQITDDLLDSSSPQVTGKPAGRDLAQGVINLPLILLLKNPLYRDKITDLLQEDPLNPSLKEHITCALQESGALDQCRQKARERIRWAKESLRSMPAGFPREALGSLADYTLLRNR